MHESGAQEEKSYERLMLDLATSRDGSISLIMRVAVEQCLEEGEVCAYILDSLRGFKGVEGEINYTRSMAFGLISMVCYDDICGRCASVDQSYKVAQEIELAKLWICLIKQG